MTEEKAEGRKQKAAKAKALCLVCLLPCAFCLLALLLPFRIHRSLLFALLSKQCRCRQRTSEGQPEFGNARTGCGRACAMAAEELRVSHAPPRSADSSSP